MKRFYEKNELLFALSLIILYSVGQSFATSLNKAIGVDYSANAILNVALTAFLLAFILKNGLSAKYGLCKPAAPASRFLWFIPLVVLSSINFWNGVAINFNPADTACYITYMLCVGIVEEVLFRGLLFCAIAKDNVKLAIVISSVTFGLGHILNLFNGVSTDIVATLCQVVSAIGIGFLFVIIFHRGGSLIPCIIAHSAIDVTSAFASEIGLTPEKRIVLSAIQFVIIVAYTWILLKTLPNRQERCVAAQ